MPPVAPVVRVATVIGKVWLVLGAFLVVAVGVVAFVSLDHGTSGTPAERLRSWVTSTNLGQDIGTLEGDGTDVGRAVAARKGIVAVRTICAAEVTSAQTFGDELPSPDTKLTQLLARAYGLEYDAAESCYRAATTSSRLLEESGSDRARAWALFGEALRRVRSVTGKTVPTTTTTVLGGSTTTSIL